MREITEFKPFDQLRSIFQYSFKILFGNATKILHNKNNKILGFMLHNIFNKHIIIYLFID